MIDTSALPPVRRRKLSKRPRGWLARLLADRASISRWTAYDAIALDMGAYSLPSLVQPSAWRRTHSAASGRASGGGAGGGGASSEDDTSVGRRRSSKDALGCKDAPDTLHLVQILPQP